jgi:hypothetical protein
LAAVLKWTAACETFTVALALVASSKGADPTAMLPTNSLRREIAAEPKSPEFLMIPSLARMSRLASQLANSGYKTSFQVEVHSI